jgi:hypothetical protein
MNPHHDASLHLNLVDREETFDYLVDRLSVVAARLSNEEFRRLISAMAQARTQAKHGQQLPPG